MKIKTNVTTLSVIIALAMMPILTLSQTENPTPNAAGSFSTFSPPQNMGVPLNAPEQDQLPAPAPNGLSLYFSSSRAGGQGGQDIWVSQRATLSSAWGAPQNLGTVLNTSSNDTVSSISPDGREMFMQSNRTGGSGGVDIYISTRTDVNNDFGWTAPVNAGAPLNTTFNDLFGVLFINPANGNGTLYFNSDRNTVGFNDIFQSTRNAGGTFNAPVPVSELNLAASTEERTSISRDGLEFYFSSNRLVPTTNQAVFVSTRASVSAPWSPPVPVAGLNTSGSNAQPMLSADSTLLYHVSNRAGGFGLGDIYSSVRASVNRTSPADFDGDGRSDISVFRPSEGNWYILQSGSSTFRAQHFGANGDRIAPGDYDGDGRTDLAIFRPSTGVWWISKSSDASVSTFSWGISTDKPVAGDYDGDGKTDIAVYRDGTWYIVQSSNGSFRYDLFGLSSDIPVAGAN